jgi:hypothetical protein
MKVFGESFSKVVRMLVPNAQQLHEEAKAEKAAENAAMEEAAVEAPPPAEATPGSPMKD